MSTRYLPYTLALRSPLLVTTPGGDPNSAATLSWIPGSLFRGSVARLLGGNTDPDFDDLVLDGVVRYLNAYPVSGEVRTLPAPLSLRAAKYPPPSAPDDVVDLAAFDGWPGTDHNTNGRWPEHQLRPIGASFLEPGTTQAAAEVRIQGRMHQQRDRAKGRAWTDRKTNESHGTVFGYEAIDADQEFAGVVAVDADDERAQHLATRLEQLLSGVVLLGRSRRAGYGGDPIIRWGPWQTREIECPQRHTGGLASGSTVHVVLTSHYVGRDHSTGQPDPTCLVDELRSHDGLDALAPGAMRRRWAFVEVGGYNRTWQLPLPRRLALAAGSVLVLKSTADIKARTLEAAEHLGLGDRRTEGYGRFVWLDAVVSPHASLLPPRAAVVQDVRGAASGDLAVQLERRIAIQRLDRAIEETAAEISSRADGAPSPSLLSRLRAPMRRGAGAGLAELRAWVSDADPGSTPGADRLRPPARRQLERCRVTVDGRGTTTLRQWLHDLAAPDANAHVAALLGLSDIASSAHIGPSSQVLLAYLTSAEQMLSHRARLIDAVLEWLSRRAKTTIVREAGTG